MLEKKIIRAQFVLIQGAGLILAPFLFLGLFLGSANASLIDANFKTQRALGTKASASVASSNEVHSLYRNVFSKTMYSKCRWFPSDSQFLAIKSKACGSATGTVLAFGRFMSEADAVMVGSEILNDHGHIRFYDLDSSCEVF